MEQIVPGVYGVGFGYVSAFIVAGEVVTLVDAAVPKRAPKLQAALAEAGSGRALTNVLVTHHHVDHVGSLNAIAPEGVTVWAHPLDAPVIRGEAPAPRPASRSGLDRAGVKVMERFGPKAPPARVDRELTDGEQIPIEDGFEAHHTPGHTAGHISFLYPSKRLLFVGDAAANQLGRLGPPFGLYSEDHDAVRKSITKLAALDFDVACFGHGRVLKGSACVRFRKLAERLA
jgi:glyoxylase-like metal-dependent hydrolase (beta-lactamase superfamily II)